MAYNKVAIDSIPNSGLEVTETAFVATDDGIEIDDGNATATAIAVRNAGTGDSTITLVITDTTFDSYGITVPDYTYALPKDNTLVLPARGPWRSAAGKIQVKSSVSATVWLSVYSI